MQTINPAAFRIIVREGNRTIRSFTVHPDGTAMVAVSPKTLRTGSGPRLSFGWQGYDVVVDGVRYRFTEQLPGKDFVVVPWVPEMDES